MNNIATLLYTIEQWRQAKSSRLKLMFASEQRSDTMPMILALGYDTQIDELPGIDVYTLLLPNKNR
jgi:hypothetical protein